MVTTIGAALWCTTGKHPCDTGSATRACGCTPRFGVLHDVAATAAALGKLGYAVEVCSCSSTFDIGVDEHGTLWESAEAYEANKDKRGGHIVIYVDDMFAHRSGGDVISRWLWRRWHPQTGPEAQPPEALTGVLHPPTSYESYLLAPQGADFLGTNERSPVGAQLGVPAVVEASPMLVDPSFQEASSHNPARPATRLCYSQPPDVGLATLIAMWPAIKRVRPKATLTILSCNSSPESTACEAARAVSDRAVHVAAGTLMGSELAGALASCAFDLIPVEHPNLVELGSLLRAQVRC